MRKYAEVWTKGAEPTQLAALDVTSEADNGRLIMDELKAAYPDCEYKWHVCRHDDGAGCLVTIDGQEQI